MVARHSRPGRSTSRTDPVSRCSSLFYCSLDPGGFFYLDPTAVRPQASANDPTSTTTTTTPTPNRRNSSTDLAWSRSRGCRASSTNTTTASMSTPSMATELLILLFAASKPTSGLKSHPYSMCAHTVPIECSRALILTTRSQNSRVGSRLRPTPPSPRPMISIAPDYQTPRRMAAKLQAMPLPELRGKRVLDVGCDAGAWCWLAAEPGAADVLGLDRGREVRGRGFVDVIKENRRCAAHEGRERCRFERIEIGKQYHIFGHFDVVFCFSVYHHLFEAAGGDHVPIWLWLWFHARLSRAVLLWEGPVDTSDPVVRVNVSAEHHHTYTRAAILAAASKFFEPEYIGPALHEPTREVWRFRPRAV